MGGKQKALKQLHRDAGEIQKAVKKVTDAAKDSAGSKRTMKQVERLVIPLTVVTICLNGLLNVGEALKGNGAATLVAVQTILLGLFVGLIEYDKAEYRRRSKMKYGPAGNWGVVSNGLTASLTGEHRAKMLITKPVEYSKVLAIAAIESLAFGWAGLLSLSVVAVRTALLLR